jgi:hypothetical protein
MKPKTRNNTKAGRALQRIRVENGILEQCLLSKAIGVLENKVRDREIGVASVTTVDILRYSLAFRMDAIEIASQMISPIAIGLDKQTTNNPERIGLWVKGKFGQDRKWCQAIAEKDFPGRWVPYEHSFQDALLYLNDTLEEIRRDVEDQIKRGVMAPFVLNDCSHLGLDWDLARMKEQGRRLKAVRLRKGFASQWSAANRIQVNPSWIQVREAANVVIKIEDLIAIAEAWDMSPFKLVEFIFAEETPTDEDLKILRRKYC